MTDPRDLTHHKMVKRNTVDMLKRAENLPTYNYVGTDPSRLDILAKYGVAGSPCRARRTRSARQLPTVEETTMAQSALTVTPPSPTPPTNMSFTGATPPNPPNYTKNTMADPKNWSYVNPKDFPPPYFDDGTAGVAHRVRHQYQRRWRRATGATAGGTEGTYPGAASGTVPASTRVAHEAAGTEVVVTSPGSVAAAPTQQVSVLGAYTTTPNASHASYLTGTAGVNTPTTSAASGASNVSGAGTTLLTVTGTNFNRSSVVYVNGVAQTTNYVSATSLTVTNAPKRATAGTLPVTVINGVGGTPSNATNWTFT